MTPYLSMDYPVCLGGKFCGPAMQRVSTARATPPPSMDRPTEAGTQRGRSQPSQNTDSLTMSHPVKQFCQDQPGHRGRAGLPTPLCPRPRPWGATWDDPQQRHPRAVDNRRWQWERLTLMPKGLRPARPCTGSVLGLPSGGRRETAGPTGQVWVEAWRGPVGAWGPGHTKAVSCPLLPSPASSATSASARTGSWSRWTSGPGSPDGAVRMTIAPGTSPTRRWARPRAGHPLCPQNPHPARLLASPDVGPPAGLAGPSGRPGPGSVGTPRAQGHDPARSQLCAGSRICGTEGR